MADSTVKKLIFAVAGYNLAETGRMIEIAREAKKHFRVIFASYGGRFEPLIEEQGFALKRMEPWQWYDTFTIKELGISIITMNRLFEMELVDKNTYINWAEYSITDDGLRAREGK